MKEQRDTRQEQLEGRRAQRFLLALVVILASLFVCLEYSIEPEDPLDDPDLLSQLTLDQELPPMLQEENQLMLAPKAEPKPETQIVVVDNDEEPDLRQEEEPVEEDLSGDLDETEEEEDTPLAPPEEDDEEAVSFNIVEDLPQFPGGPSEFMKWLTRNLKYPAQAQEQKQQGRVVAEFIVGQDGSITGVRIVESLNELCDREVLRVLRMMPRWTAGILNGQPCRTKVCIPVVFKM